jgi:hypothetical protein
MADGLGDAKEDYEMINSYARENMSEYDLP